MDRIMYSCSRDTFTNWFSLAILAILLSVVIVTVVSVLKSGGTTIVYVIVFANLMLIPVLIAATVAYLPLRYVITSDKVIVDRLGPDVEIALSDIRSIIADNGAMLKGSIRLGANGGLGGYVGLYTNKTLGRYRAYRTRSDRVVLIETHTTKYVLSPDEPEQFIAALHEKGIGK